MFVFCWGEEVEVYKLSELEDDHHYVSKRLPSLRRPAKEFALAISNNCLIHLSGGVCDSHLFIDDKDRPGKLVSTLDTEKEQWFEEPDLNYSRDNHSSVFLAGKLYVIGGYHKIEFKKEQPLDLIECLYTEPSKVWHVLKVKSELFLRLNAPAIAISNEEIAVVGGDDFEREPLKNGYILNIKRQQVEEILTDN